MTLGEKQFGWTILVFRFCFAAIVFGFTINSTSGCFVCIVPYQSLLDKVEASQQVVVVSKLDRSTSQWKVVRVIKGDGLATDQIITLDDSNAAAAGAHRILRRDSVKKPWQFAGSADAQLIRFLAAAVKLSAERAKLKSVRDQSQYYRFFLPFLEHTHPAIADSAYNKIAKAPYNVLRTLKPHLNSDQLLTWINQPQIAKKRGSLYITLLGVCGGEREKQLVKKRIDSGWERQDTENLAALLAAYAELHGEDAIGFIEKSYLQNRERKLGELIAAVNALRVHGYTNGSVSRKRIMASFHLLIKERTALVEMIIDDCAQWKEWSIAPKLLEIYAGGKQPWNNKQIVDFMKSCPLPIARRFLKEVSVSAAKTNRNK